MGLISWSRIWEFRFLGRGVFPVACLTLKRRLLVENDGISIDQLRCGVAFITGHVGVATRERERRSLVMVERRRHPPFRVVAIGTRSLAGAILELAPVRLLVAGFALLQRPFELDVVRARQRPMTLTAGYGAVRAEQRKLRL